MAQAGPKARIRPLDLTALPTGPRAERAAAFIERYCRVTKGAEAGQPLRLRPWQREILAAIFDPNDRIRRFYLQLPRKNGKSALAAAIGLYCLVADGEQGGEVYSVAGSLDQAGIVWGTARRMVELDPDLSGALQIFGASGAYYSSKIYDPATDSVFRPMASAAGTLHGLNPSCVIFDEVHNQGDDSVWEAMSLAMGFRERPLLLAVTTPGHDETSLAHSLYEHGRAGGDPAFGFRAFEPAGGADSDWQDEAVWASANPALGDFLRIDNLRAALRSTPEHSFRRFHLGQWTATADAWLPHGEWAGRTAPRPLRLDEPIWVGFDGSLSGDSTALVAATADRYVTVLGAWENPGIMGWRVPKDEVNARVLEVMETHNVRELLCDPYYWGREIAEWAARFGASRVLEIPTAVRQRLAPATTAFYRAVVEGQLTHDGDPRLARHVGNCVVRPTPVGDVVAKPSKDSPAKIDLAVAAILAYSRLPAGGAAGPRVW